MRSIIICKDKLKPKLIYFFAISGVTAIRFSLSLFSEIEAKFIKKFLKNYTKILPLKLKLILQQSVPQKQI
jgi:hypothetical protein